MSRASAERLADILAAIAAVERAEALLLATEQTGDRSLSTVAFHAILYNLIVIGEATKGLDAEVRLRHPAVPWREVARMRDLLAHHYFRVRSDVVRATIDAPLTVLRRACETERARLGER